MTKDKNCVFLSGRYTYDSMVIVFSFLNRLIVAPVPKQLRMILLGTSFALFFGAVVSLQSMSVPLVCVFETRVMKSPLYSALFGTTNIFSPSHRVRVTEYATSEEQSVTQLYEMVRLQLVRLTIGAAHKDIDQEALIITQIIVAQSQHPAYQSFFHGAPGSLALLLELQKKLYERATHTAVSDFEFLRVRGTRDALRGMTVGTFCSGPDIDDNTEPDRTNLLSVGYIPWPVPFNIFLLNRSPFSLSTERWIRDALTSYRINVPERFELPSVSSGLLLHILLKRSLARRLVYNARNYGIPADSRALPDPLTPAWLDGQARIILDPTVFDVPSDDVKIFRYDLLDGAEKTKITAFCDSLLT
jgi:hypothetical protein